MHNESSDLLPAAACHALVEVTSESMESGGGPERDELEKTL